MAADGFDGVLRANTDLVGILGRTYLGGPDDVLELEKIQSQYVLKPLSEHLGTAPVRAVPRWPVWRKEALDSLEFFTLLDFLLGFFPILPSDADLRAGLDQLGVGSGDFEPAALTGQVREELRQGIADGRAALTGAASRAQDSTGWFGTRAQHGSDYLTRAVGVAKGLYGLPAEEAWYAGWLADDQGHRPPDAAERDYVLHFPAGQLPPARFFWSATMYRLPRRLLVDNPINRCSIGDRTPGLVYGDDGSLTLHIQRERPTDPPQAANWLPAPDGPFTLAIRVYGPAPEVLDGLWQRPQLAVRT